MEKQGGLIGFVIGFTLSFGLAAALVFFGGFLSFIALVSADPITPSLRDDVDAIVVLTGGDARLEAGMVLLAQGQKDHRLLLSGVNVAVDRGEIRKLIDPATYEVFDCCVDLDKSAINTVGNARETVLWASQHRYTRIVVVTANYHMPRSLAEMNRAAPEIVWIAHSVHPADIHLTDWWRWPGSTRLLMSEYVKYLAMKIRFRLETV